ncbi:hypothetical protein ABEB36_008588 [Hypothenemus hampei]|uniref:RecA family profile 1 domain-containing protein n=1 Tax=Hypothenemus hampei TaxID=57062 RepID=A0ABD1EME0_HYPHA
MEKIRDCLGSDMFALLLKENITTTLQIVMCPVNILREITGAQLNVLTKVLHIAGEDVLQDKIYTANHLKPFDRISTGCKSIDSILDGGIPINGIAELYGSSGVGKTQFCLQLSLHLQLPIKLGGREKEVVYFCTEDVFPSRRLNQLAASFKDKHNVVLDFQDHIYVTHITSSLTLQKCLQHKLSYFFKYRNIGLIIIDSIAGLFRAETENTNYVTRSHEFSLIVKSLNDLQDRFGCGILIVNQVLNLLYDKE